MLTAISRALDKFNLFFLSIMIASIFGTEVFASFTVALSYALIIFSIVEIGGQQLFSYYYREVSPISANTLNVIKIIVFICISPLIIIKNNWAVFIISVGYLFESFSNSIRFQLFRLNMHSQEAKLYIIERILTSASICIIYFYWLFGNPINFSLISIYVYISTLKICFYFLNMSFLTRFDGKNQDALKFDTFVKYLSQGRYFIITAFAASLFMQVDILAFSWFGASDNEISILSAFIRLVTATFFISTVIQQFILPNFGAFLADPRLFKSFESNIRAFAFFLTVTLISVSETYLLLFFGDRQINDHVNVGFCGVILLMVFSRFCRDPISVYLGQLSKNKLKLAVLLAVLPIKLLVIWSCYKFWNISVAIMGLVIIDALVYLLFRWGARFKVIDIQYIFSLILLAVFSINIIYLSFTLSIIIAIVGSMAAFYYFNLITRHGVLNNGA